MQLIDLLLVHNEADKCEESDKNTQVVITSYLFTCIKKPISFLFSINEMLVPVRTSVDLLWRNEYNNGLY